ncbi:hypothetical protein EYF80_059597 [Liparis tanakae]|uniref:Uncharacterized protein n=1 Tax=Liparis tanakae TaxID=230148 RepID=A0A4Z2ENT4_9TELE|nr:hypothetical protein EYF80_059597 [Liparis tanakae]
MTNEIGLVLGVLGVCGVLWGSGGLGLWSCSGPQKVVCSRQWQPQPAGHWSRLLNQASMCPLWPPWPQPRQQLEEPRTAAWHTEQRRATRRQAAQRGPRDGLRQ